MIEIEHIPEQIETSITRLYGIRYPIIQGGMIWTSGWKLAVAVSQAGGLGLIGAGSMKPDLLREHIRKARNVWDGALGVNLPLMRGDSTELAKVIVEEGIKIVFSSAGNPGKFTEYFHDNGCTVTHVVPSLKLAKKAESRGVDAIVGEGSEAGGHNGYEEISTIVLTARLADHINIPLIAAGGIRDGRGLAAVLALGADGAQIGTRFACTIEASCSDAYKRAIIDSMEPATVLTLKKFSPTRMLQGKFAKKVLEAEASGATTEAILELHGKGRAKLGTFLGNAEEGYLEAGEVAGDIIDLPSSADVVKGIVSGYIDSVRELPLFPR